MQVHADCCGLPLIAVAIRPATRLPLTLLPLTLASSTPFSLPAFPPCVSSLRSLQTCALTQADIFELLPEYPMAFVLVRKVSSQSTPRVPRVSQRSY